MTTQLIPSWLLPTFALIPALAWMFIGVGLPWALAILPREDWRDRVLVAATTLALGALITTLAMLLIGTFFSFSIGAILMVTGILAAAGALIAFNRRQLAEGITKERTPLSFVEKMLIVLIAAAVLIRIWNTAYFPYTTYDEFWVYGYNAQLFMLRGNIPSTIGYYPQLVPLSYTYAQLMWGSIDPHAARTVVPIFDLASILFTYLLGRTFGGRRVGLIAAAVWTLYPHHGAWSQFGDLEIPVTAWFTGCAAFLLIGWQRREWRYGILSGLLLGAALWTKPTAGALIESLGLLLVILALHDWRSWQTRFVFLILAVGAIPGGIWYVRNVLLGLPPLVLPLGYWQNAAQRSGQELGWLLLIAAALALLAISRHQRAGAAIAGVALLLIGALPSAFGGSLPDGEAIQLILIGQIPPAILPTHLGLIDLAPLIAGAGLLIYALSPLWKAWSAGRKIEVALLVVFIAPYWITWFWSYSYHFRLSFAVVPMQIVVLAGITAALLPQSLPQLDQHPQVLRKLILALLIVAISVPGLVSGMTALEPAFAGELNTDDAKIARGNPALMDLVYFLRDQKAKAGRTLKIAAPGELRLPYFFPDDQVLVDDYPLHLDQIADVDFFVDSSVGQRLYIEQGLYQGNQILASLTRENVMRRVYTTDDGNFRFSVYTVHNADRFIVPTPNGADDAEFGDFAHYLGYDLSTLENSAGENIYLTLWWQALKPADLDYSVFIHLWDEKNQRLIQAWGGQPVEGAFSIWQGVPGAQFSIAYRTTLWQTGEVIKDEWKMRIDPNAPAGEYELRIGLFEPISGKRLMVMRNGEPVGEWIRINRFTVRGQ
ncbi:MAG: glycosyltransferase family 39 protein [Anaerolineae bacterium]